MKKYILEDLILDESTTQRSENKPKAKGKSTTIALIIIVLIIGLFLVKTITGSSTDTPVTGEAEIAAVNIEKPITDREESLTPAEQEAERVADELSISAGETESLEPLTEKPKEPKSDEILSVETEEVILPAKQEVQQVVKEPSVAIAKNESLEPLITESPETDLVTTKTEELLVTKPEIALPTEEEPLKIADILPAIEVPAEESAPKPEQSIENTVNQANDPTEADSKPEEVNPQSNTTPAEKPKEDPVDLQEKPKTISAVKETQIATTKEEVVKDNPNKKKELTANKVADKPKIKSKSKPEPKHKSKGLFNIFSSKTKYYVQVGSYAENPPPRLLSRIKNAGFNYIVTQNRNTGVKKVKVGPYSTLRGAKKAVGKVKKTTGINGFIVKYKK